MKRTSSLDVQFPITALREIKLLKMLSHGNVLQLVEMAIERPKGITVHSHHTQSALTAG